MALSIISPNYIENSLNPCFSVSGFGHEKEVVQVLLSCDLGILKHCRIKENNSKGASTWPVKN